MKKYPFLLALLCVSLASCGGGSNPEESSSKLDVSSLTSSSIPLPSSETSLKEFAGVTFASATVDYDGNPHTLTVEGAPAEASVTYAGNGPFVDAGSYPMSATLKADGYKDLTLNATLTIRKIDFGNIEFKDASFEYDGNPHTITITGNIPIDATVTYSSSDTPSGDNAATNVGTYLIKATITHKNFNKKELTATMTIKGEDSDRFMLVNSGKLYFQNAVHDDKLYVADLSSNTVTRVSNDVATYMVKDGTGVSFVSKSLLSSIKRVAPSGTGYTTDILQTKGASYLQKGSGSVIYYAVNGLTQNSSGIYKFDYTNTDAPVETLLSQGKAKYLTLENNILYFADGNNGDKLSSISINGANQTRQLVVNEKINNLIAASGVLYFTVNNLIGDYIARYSISGGTMRKLTSDAGASLNLAGSDLYYVNVDLLSSAFIGKGIYRVSSAPTSDNNAPGTQVVNASAQGISSLYSDGSYLYYYDINGYKLMKRSISTGASVDLLSGFVRPADPAPLSVSAGLKVATYGDAIYYQDLYDERTLHRYNTVTKANVRITSTKVADFSVIGDEIYANVVSLFVNNDTYRFNLLTGAEPEKVNANSGFDFTKIGDYVYYARDNAAGAATAINRFNVNTLVDEEVYTKGVSNLRAAGNKLLFIDGYQIFEMNTTTLATAEIKADGKSVHTDAFDTDGTSIYYRDMFGVLYASKQLSRISISGTNKTAIVSEKTDPISIKVIGNEVFYYCDTLTAANNGLFRVSKTAAASTTGACVLAANSTYYAQSFCGYGSDIYFINRGLAGAFGDSYLYKTPIAGGTPTKIA